MGRKKRSSVMKKTRPKNATVTKIWENSAATPSSFSPSITDGTSKKGGIFSKESLKEAKTLIAPMIIGKGLESADEIREFFYDKSFVKKEQAIVSAKENIQSSEKIRLANEERRKQEEEQLERLKELQELKYKSVDQKKEAQSITESLNRRYKNLNLSFDPASGGVQGLEEAQENLEQYHADEKVKDWDRTVNATKDLNNALIDVERGEDGAWKAIKSRGKSTTLRMKAANARRDLFEFDKNAQLQRKAAKKQADDLKNGDVRKKRKEAAEKEKNEKTEQEKTYKNELLDRVGKNSSLMNSGEIYDWEKKIKDAGSVEELQTIDQNLGEALEKAKRIRQIEEEKQQKNGIKDGSGTGSAGTPSAAGQAESSAAPQEKTSPSASPSPAPTVSAPAPTPTVSAPAPAPTVSAPAAPAPGEGTVSEAQELNVERVNAKELNVENSNVPQEKNESADPFSEAEKYKGAPLTEDERELIQRRTALWNAIEANKTAFEFSPDQFNAMMAKGAAITTAPTVRTELSGSAKCNSYCQRQLEILQEIRHILSE